MHVNSPEISMKRPLLALLGLGCAIALAGCLETSQVFTLNPDGSGKVAFDIRRQPTTQGMGETDAPEPAVQALRELEGYMRRGEGVEAWSDLVHEVMADGRIRFAGVAYFRDFNKMGQEGAKVIKREDGGLDVQWRLVPEREANPTSKPTLSDEEVAERMRGERSEFAKDREDYRTLRMEVVLVLPSALEQVRGFQKTGENTVRLLVEGKDFIAAAEKIMKDDALLGQIVRDEEIGQKMLIKNLFNVDEPLMTASTRKDAKALFDYDAEVRKAKAGEPEMFKKLGVESPSTAPAEERE
jgi:hypothetical protein